MPRGIPKDPNHPRNSKNKKSDASAAGAPKRRGRPPGSKNASKSQETVNEKAVVSAPAAKAPKQSPAQNVQTYHNPQAHLNLSIVRDNIMTLSHCGGPEASQAMNSQIEQLMRLTEEIIGHDDEVVSAQPVTNQVPAISSSLPTPPSFNPPPFPPQLPG